MDERLSDMDWIEMGWHGETQDTIVSLATRVSVVSRKAALTWAQEDVLLRANASAAFE